MRLSAVSRRGTCSTRQISAVPRSRSLRCRAGLHVGDALPHFELETDESKPGAKKILTSEEIVKDKGAVLFFYPKAGTSGCTTQACGFNDNYGTFEKAGYGVFGISADKPSEQAAWKAQHGFRYPLLCDPDYTVLPALGVAKPDGGVNRTHMIIEKGGKVKEVVYGVSSKDSVPSALESLSRRRTAGW